MPINPFITNNFLDTCAFDPKYHPEDKAAQEIFRLHEENELSLLLAHSVAKEIQHPNTPRWVKEYASTMIFTIDADESKSEARFLGEIEAILAGNGKRDTIKQDAEHILVCQKYGSYFITADRRILKRRDALYRLCSIVILKPSEFLILARDYIADEAGFDALTERKGLTQSAVMDSALSVVAKQQDLGETQCEACGRTVSVILTQYKAIEVRVPDPKPGHGLTITRRGSVCEDCLEPDSWNKVEREVQARTLADYNAGRIPITID